MNLNNIKIHNWMLSLNKVSPFFINRELYEKMTDRRFINNYSDIIYLMGEYKANTHDNQKFFALTTPIKLIHNDVAITEKGNKIFLGTKSKEYISFENAVTKNIPLIYNWVIGINESKLQERRTQYKNNTLEEKEIYISCNMVENGIISYVKDKVIDQNIEDSTLTLKKSGKVFISWGAKNTYQSIGIKKYEESIYYQYEEVTDKLEQKKHQLKYNQKALETLHIKNEELNKYTPHQIEELYKEILIKKDQLEIANKRIIKSIQKNEEKADNIFNEIKRLRTMNLNIIKGIPVNLITEQDLLTKNINMRIKFFENPKDIESDLENKDIGKLFRKNYVYLKKGIKN